MVLMVLGVKQSLCFFGGSIEGKPAFILGVEDTFGWDATVDEPLTDCVFGGCRWSKSVDDLLLSPMLAIFRRVWVGAMSVSWLR